MTDPLANTVTLEEVERQHQLADLVSELDLITLHGKPVPVRRWLVPGLIPWGSVTLLGGDGGLGKSLLMLQVQVAASIGAKWIGQDVERVKSFGLYAEDDHDEIHRRLVDICRHHECSLGDLENMRAAPHVGRDNLLAVERSGRIKPTALYDAVLDRCQRLGAQILILDTVADTFGGNENFRSEVRTFINLMRNIAIQIDGAVIMTAHPSNAGLATGSGISGSTAWSNSVRSRLYLTRPKVADDVAEPLANERILRTMKSNYHGITDDILLTWRDGVFIADPAPSGQVRAILDRKAERAFLDCLDAATAQQRNLSEHKTAPNFAPKVMARFTQADGVKAPDLERAMETLFATNAIAIGTPFIRSNRHPASGIVRTDKGQATGP